jgi:hypothetical protein
VRKRRSLIAVLVLLLLVGVVIAGRSAMRMFGRRGPPPPRQTDVTLIAGWMTVPYVSRTYRVRPDEIFQGIGVPSQGNERKSIDELAAATGRPSGELVAAVQATVRDAQARQPPPGQRQGGPPGDRGPPAKVTP